MSRARRASRGMRLHIGIFGRRNVGKSSLLNAITHQDVSIVSPRAGTTTDPVEKPMELLPLGPVLFIDTAGVDDVGAVGEQRVARTRQAIERTDLGIIVCEGVEWGEFEDQLYRELKAHGVPVVVVANKIDLVPAGDGALEPLRELGLTVVAAAAPEGEGILDLRQALLQAVPEGFLDDPVVVGDLVSPGDLVVLVTPIDKEAPRGRLILPQVQTLRDLLDHDCMSLVVKEHELCSALELLRSPPALVVTDSQAFLKVAADTPVGVPMTSFSILFARLKGDLVTQVEGAMAVDRLRPGSRVLVAEACTHHPIADDIGRVKIPRWLTQYVGGPLEFTHTAGRDFPDDVSSYDLVVHCGACTFNRRLVLSRLVRCRHQGVPVTNYGLVIAWSLGILGRALEPFPAAREAWLEARGPGAP